MHSIQKEIFRISTQEQFQECCLKVFHLQYEHNPIYRQYVDLLGVEPCNVKEINSIPFLPISLFKSQRIITSFKKRTRIEKIFTSSSTTGMVPSKHFVTDLSLYEESLTECFKLFYGEPTDWAVLALLPSYLERNGSSLVYMADLLISMSNCNDSGFHLYDYEGLYNTLLRLRGKKQKTFLIGVSFALLDFVEHYSLKPEPEWEFCLLETGGMKGRREEITREELHRKLSSGFGIPHIHSEYGMCELLSQAYSKGDGIFFSPPWMKILIRDIYNPLSIMPDGCGKKGAVNIIDLANLNSCSFIETEDMGRSLPNNSFTIEDRLNHAERRGCNMLIE